MVAMACGFDRRNHPAEPLCAAPRTGCSDYAEFSAPWRVQTLPQTTLHRIAVPQPIITLLTDFGTDSPYVAAMKGVILSINPAVTLVDLTHAIPPQDIRQGALVLADVVPRFPAGTIHIAVVDPGVGSARQILCAEIGSQRCLGPDNGLFSRLARQTPNPRITAVTEPQFWLPTVSATFHGRDVMAPVAAHLSLGLDPRQLGPPLAQMIELDWPEVVKVPGEITGRVASVDSFGNLITDIRSDQLADVPTDERLQVLCDEHETRGLFRTYADQPEMTLIALVGSSGCLELAIVGDSAKLMLGVSTGAPVTLRW